MTGGVAVISMDYLGGFHYQGTALKFFPTAEGYVQATALKVGFTYSYVYNYTDHLGNIRLSYAQDPENPHVLKIIEESHYYPFGLKHANYNSDQLAFKEKDPGPGLRLMAAAAALDPVPQYGYNYKFLGQERQDEMGLNWDTFRYRNYDYAIGRFMGIDPVAADYVSISSYQFAHNNPVWKVEIEGLEGHVVNGMDLINYEPGKNPSSHIPLPVGNQSSGKSSGNKIIRTIAIPLKNRGLTTGYPGQALDELVTLGIQWAGSKISGKNVTKQTSENVQFGTSILVFIASRGKNGKAGTEITEQFLKKNSDDLAESITDINKAFSDGAQLNKGSLESAINTASYYDSAAQQGASLFNSIVKGHIFMNGNKRTASEFIIQFAKDNGIKLKLSANELKVLTSEIANGSKIDVEELAKRLFSN